MNKFFKMKNRIINYLVICVVLLLLQESAWGNVKLPVLISDGMVLLRNTKLNIWGWASPGEKVRITLNDKTFNVVTDRDGNWKVVLPPMKPGGPYSMEVKGRNTIIIKDILVGDVWFCSGQSNMVLNMERVKEKYPDDIANANFPEIRNFFSFT
jgi:sialate O-acetylesterase